MKKIFTIILLSLLYSTQSICQIFEYSYDDVGNRIQRQYIIIHNPERTGDDTTFTNQEQMAAKPSITVFPNPASTEINITIESLEEGNTAEVHLYDFQGKRLISRQQTKRNDIIDVLSLKSGTYYLEIIKNSERISYKIVKTD